MLIEDPRLEKELIAQRQAWGADHHDEVWEGVYFMAPLPNNEHQELVYNLAVALHAPIVAAGEGWQAALRMRDATRTEILKYCGEPDLETG